jgi:hypothetical protein
MEKTIWYGMKGNDVRFADNQQALVSNGVNNPKSFTVNGEVTGLNLIGNANEQPGAQSPSSPTA